MTASPAVAKSTSPARGERRMLRVGIVHGRRIVEERLLARAGDVTIGTSPHSTFIVPWDDVPRRWRLFEERGGRRFLHLTAGMTARIADGAALTNVGARAAGEPARPIPLSDRARGKVTVGDTTVLFQLLRPPPPQPRAQLPLSVRRRFGADIDRLFAAVIAFTVLLHIAFVVYLRQVEWPRRPSLEEIPDRFVRRVVQMPRPTPPAFPEPPEESLPSSVPHPRAPAQATARAPRTPPKSREALEAEVRQIGLIPLLTARAADGHSAITDVLSAGAVDRPLEEALRDVGGLGIASTDSLRVASPGPGHGKVATVDDLRAPGGIAGARDIGPVPERDVASRLKVDRPVIEGGHADLESITREIRSRRRAIAACYERALKQRPTLAGKLVVRFSIVAAGTVSAVDIDDDTLGAPEVGACVRALVLRWRFAPPTEAPVELSFPFVFQAGG
jgi:hypothetical protein